MSDSAAHIDVTTPFDVLLALEASNIRPTKDGGGCNIGLLTNMHSGAEMNRVHGVKVPESTGPYANGPFFFGRWTDLMIPFSMTGYIPQPIYGISESSKFEPGLCLQQMIIGYGLYCVSQNFKDILAQHNLPNSDFHELSVVYPPRRNTRLRGDSQMVSGKYWLWHVRDSCDLIDFDASDVIYEEWTNLNLNPKQGTSHPPDQVRAMIDAGQPIPAEMDPICHWITNAGSCRLVLKPGLYEQADAFQIRGLRKKHVFISPRLAESIRLVGLLKAPGEHPESQVVIKPYRLDRIRAGDSTIRQAGLEMPPLRIAGTDRLIKRSPEYFMPYVMPFDNSISFLEA